MYYKFVKTIEKSLLIDIFRYNKFNIKIYLASPVKSYFLFFQLVTVFKTFKSDMKPGASPIKILQRKFYAIQFFKHSDWLLKFINQSGCLKISIA